jgi:hypothetical protein
MTGKPLAMFREGSKKVEMNHGKPWFCQGRSPALVAEYL